MPIYVTHNFPKALPQKEPFHLTPEQILLVMPIGDTHWGSEGCPQDHIRNHIQWGVDRGAWFLGMGDYLEWTSTTQREILRQLRSTARQTLDDVADKMVDDFYQILKPSRGRWLGMLGGNHTHVYRDGTSADQKLAEKLGTVYLGDEGYIELFLGKQKVRVVILAHHGVGGGTLAGSGLNVLEKQPMAWPDGDIFLMAHIHTKVNTPLDALFVAPNGVLYHRTRLLARTGGFLRAYLMKRPLPNTVPAELSEGTYLEKRAARPAALGGIVISIGVKYNEEAKVWIPDLHHSA